MNSDLLNLDDRFTDESAAPRADDIDDVDAQFAPAIDDQTELVHEESADEPELTIHPDFETGAVVVIHPRPASPRPRSVDRSRFALAVTVSIMSHLGVGALCFAFAGAFVFVSARQTDQRLGASEGGLIDAAPSGASADAPPSQAQPSPSVSAPTDRPADVNENVAPASAEAFSQASTDQPVADNLDATEPPPMIGPTSDPLAAPIFPQRKTASAAVAPASAVAAAHLSAESGHSSSSSASASAAAAVHSMGAARVRGTPGGRRDGFDLDGRGIPIPEYPAESRRRREEGMVKLDLEILPDGTVGRIAIVDDGGYSRLAAASVTAARAAHFEPGTYDGRPCVCHLIVPYRFTLR